MVNEPSLNELALFAGAGGGILGGHLLGWRTVCAVEWEQYPASVLCARQNDKILSPFPIWDDVQTFDGKPWRGIVDVVSGGFPCQDISAAGKGAGIDGERSSMWKHMARIIGEARPRYAFVENSPMLTSRGLGVVLADLSSMGFNAKWGVVSAADIGANHQRERIWIRAEQRDFLSHAEHNGFGRGKQQPQSTQEADVVDTQSCGSGRNTGKLQTENEQQTSERQKDGIWESDYAGQRNGEIYDSNSTQCERNELSERGNQEYPDISRASWWDVEPNVGRVADGVAARVDRLKAIGNGQVPLCAATAWELLK